MKLAILTILLLFSAAFSAAAQEAEKQPETAPLSDVERFRAVRDKGFRTAGESPLLREDFLNFKGLEYFAVDPKFAVRAKLEKTTDEQFFLMPTTFNTTRKYLKYGVLKFALEGRAFSLNVYRSEASAVRSGLLFIPFRDLTNGAETYGAGRYLDIEAPAEAELILDFNFAYNMSCAYGSERYNCSVPPKENFLQTAIKAGEKIYPHAAKQ